MIRVLRLATSCQELWIPHSRNVQGQVGWGSEQSGLSERFPAHVRGSWTR